MPTMPVAHCGLNADWNCRAWAVTGNLCTDASIFVLDNEDGTYALVQRFFCPTQDDNDRVLDLVHKMSEEDALATLAAAGYKIKDQT